MKTEQEIRDRLEQWREEAKICMDNSRINRRIQELEWVLDE